MGRAAYDHTRRRAEEKARRHKAAVGGILVRVYTANARGAGTDGGAVIVLHYQKTEATASDDGACDSRPLRLGAANDIDADDGGDSDDSENIGIKKTAADALRSSCFARGSVRTFRFGTEACAPRGGAKAVTPSANDSDDDSASPLAAGVRAPIGLTLGLDPSGLDNSWLVERIEVVLPAQAEGGARSKGGEYSIGGDRRGTAASRTLSFTCGEWIGKDTPARRLAVVRNASGEGDGGSNGDKGDKEGKGGKGGADAAGSTGATGGTLPHLQSGGAPAKGSRDEAVRSLKPGVSLDDFHVKVVTSDVRGAGTDSPSVTITLAGDGWDSGPRELTPDAAEGEQAQAQQHSLGHTAGGVDGGAFDSGEQFAGAIAPSQATPGGAPRALFRRAACDSFTLHVAAAGAAAREAAALAREDAPGTEALQAATAAAVRRVVVSHSSTGEAERASGSSRVVGLDPRWHLQRIDVTHVATAESASFVAGRWIVADAGSLTLLPAEETVGMGFTGETVRGVSGLPSMHEAHGGPGRGIGWRLESYELRLFTANARAAGTMAGVWAEIIGKDHAGRPCRSGLHRLPAGPDPRGNPSDASSSAPSAPGRTFSRGSEDCFEVQCVAFAEVEALRLRTDGAGLSPEWLFARAELRAPNAKAFADRKNVWHFPYHRWIGYPADGGAIECDVLVPVGEAPHDHDQEVEQATDAPTHSRVHDLRHANAATATTTTTAAAAYRPGLPAYSQAPPQAPAASTLLPQVQPQLAAFPPTTVSAAAAGLQVLDGMQPVEAPPRASQPSLVQPPQSARPDAWSSAPPAQMHALSAQVADSSTRAVAIENLPTIAPLPSAPGGASSRQLAVRAKQQSAAAAQALAAIAPLPEPAPPQQASSAASGASATRRSSRRTKVPKATIGGRARGGARRGSVDVSALPPARPELPVGYDPKRFDVIEPRTTAASDAA